MKTLLKLGAVAVFGFAMLYASDAAPQGRWAQGGQPSEIGVDVQEDLVFLREEEKLARDVYLTLYEAWGLPIFSNIDSSERQHMSRVAFLLDVYNIPDPVGDNPVGVFEEPELAELYEHLIHLGLE